MSRPVLESIVPAIVGTTVPWIGAQRATSCYAALIVNAVPIVIRATNHFKMAMISKCVKNARVHNIPGVIGIKRASVSCTRNSCWECGKSCAHCHQRACSNCASLMLSPLLPSDYPTCLRDSYVAQCSTSPEIVADCQCVCKKCILKMGGRLDLALGPAIQYDVPWVVDDRLLFGLEGTHTPPYLIIALVALPVEEAGFGFGGGAAEGEGKLVVDGRSPAWAFVFCVFCFVFCFCVSFVLFTCVYVCVMYKKI